MTGSSKSALIAWLDRPGRNRFAVIVTLLFSAVAGLGFYNHEMWRDEFEIFIELKDAPGFLSLFPAIQPFPKLYHALLYLLLKVWPHTSGFQLFHFALIVSAVFIFNKYSPFDNLKKILFSFSYFVLFEYGIISRDYSMFLLLVFLSVALMTREKHNYILIAATLVLLANHHPYGLFTSFSLFIYEGLYIKERISELKPEDKGKLVKAGLMLSVGAVYICFQYFLLAKHDQFSGAYAATPVYITLRSIWNAFFPVPGTLDMHFWNTNILPFDVVYFKDVTGNFRAWPDIAAAALSVLIFSVSLIIFSGRKRVLIVFLVNSLLQLAFLHYIHVYYVRYQGPLFIIFIYSYWLLCHPGDRPEHGESARSWKNPVLVFISKNSSYFVTSVLFVQFCAGIYCYAQDARYPFTASYAAARYIRENKLDNDIMVGHLDYVVQPISGHLNQRIYYPEIGKFSTNVLWLDNDRREISFNEVLKSAVRLRNQGKRNVLIVLSYPVIDKFWNSLLPGDLRLKYLAEFTETIVDDETYYLYLVYAAGENIGGGR